MHYWRVSRCRGSNRRTGLLPAGAAEDLLAGTLIAVAATRGLVCCLQLLIFWQSVLLKWQQKGTVTGCLQVLQKICSEQQLNEYRSAALQVLQKICWYVVLAAASSDQVTLLQTTAADKKLDQLPAYKELLQTFITKEVGPSVWLPLCREGSGLTGCQRFGFKKLLQTSIRSAHESQPCRLHFRVFA